MSFRGRRPCAYVHNRPLAHEDPRQKDPKGGCDCASLARRPSERETVVVAASSATKKAFMSFGNFYVRETDQMDESADWRPQNEIKPESVQAEPK